MSILTAVLLAALSSILTMLFLRRVVKAFLAGIEVSRTLLPQVRRPVQIHGYTPAPPFTLDQLDRLLSTDHPPNASTTAEILEAAKRSGGAAGYIKRGGGLVQ